jgi:hypothetical protein
MCGPLLVKGWYFTVWEFNLGKVYGIKCVDIGDVLKEALQTLLTEGLSITTWQVWGKESQHQFKCHPNLAKAIFLQGPEALRHSPKTKCPKQIFVMLLWSKAHQLKESVSQSEWLLWCGWWLHKKGRGVSTRGKKACQLWIVLEVPH